ncbi:unnamed protein product, partial [Adineta steineri]
MNERADSTQKEEKHTTTTADQVKSFHQLIIDRLNVEYDHFVELSSATLKQISITEE